MSGESTAAGGPTEAGRPTEAGEAGELVELATRWLDDDPDPDTRSELAPVIAAAQSGDEAAAVDLADRFAGMLEFGTAGLRGAIGAGPNRMNRAVVIRAAAGLTAWLKDEGGEPEPVVVIGFDARHKSDEFARDTAAVVVAAGGRAMVLPRPLPTPVLAFAIRYLGAHAGVMVTASHNPPQDNGYKVYLGDGSQIVPPVDAEIAAHIAAVPSVASVPRVEDGWETLGDEIEQAYVDAAASVVRPDAPRAVSVVHTSLHGVGSATVEKAFAAAGFPAPHEVSSQQAPDPDFPSVAFPNPEEPGAIDAALALAGSVRPDVVLANDPDADRCAAAVDDHGTWRMLRGDELGALLGQHVIDRLAAGGGAAGRADATAGVDGVGAGGLGGDGAVFANSIVSSRLLAAMARDAGIAHAETLTGFKWIARVPGLTYGYEEAIGYCVDPQHVQDKDGISAALLLTEMTAILRGQGRTLLDVLDDLARRHGVYATDAFSVRVDDLAIIGQIMARLRANPPSTVAGHQVSRADDLTVGSPDLPPTEGLRYYLDDDSRVIVRPSGTEPKLKVYLEVIEPAAGGAAAGGGAGGGAGAAGAGDDGLPEARRRAAERLAALVDAFRALTAP
ncbi:phosphomannomutase [Arsenicicoccus piscis]|uniref:Phosphomannomutase n=1 Tax=Arsenicicoccus piscis TaxID=673954 RepID=A0ABQ6HPI2_9MICO|nr:phosphomannomutase [Arsenicicoccus piscis]